MQKLEQEQWDHTMKGSYIATYTTMFNELATLYPGMVTLEAKKVEGYI